MACPLLFALAMNERRRHFAAICAFFVAFALAACAPSNDTPNTCAPAGGVCVRTDAPFVATGPPQATCIDSGDLPAQWTQDGDAVAEHHARGETRSPRA